MASDDTRARSQEAERIFLEFLEDHEVTDSEALERLCTEHSDLRRDLEDLARHWLRMAEMLELLGARRSLGERLKRRFGEGADPRVTLDSPRGEKDEEVEDGGAEGASAEAAKGTPHLTGWDEPAMRYRTGRRLAVGGMGTIYQVWDDHLRRLLAMKVAHASADRLESRPAEGSASGLLTRFLEEAQITGQLDHPGIVPVHDLGLDACGRVFFTMRLVKGQTLKQVFEMARESGSEWTQARVLGLVLRACEAVAYAHSKRVIHRDLKPANIMVGRFGETYVMDWGLAKVLDEPDRHDLRWSSPSITQTVVRTERSEMARELESPLVTMDGTVVGTPSYMSPEQAGGETAQLGPRSDVYSMGAVLYELLAGHMPYVRSGVKKSARTVLAEVLDHAPLPLHEIDRHIPAELIAICEKAMARDSADRYADMSAMADDLRAYLENRVVGAYRTGAWTEFRKWVVRNRGMAAGLLVAVVTLVAGLGGVAWVQAGAREVLDVKNRELRSAHREASRQKDVAERQRDELLRLADLKRLADLQSRADALWPAWPDQIDAMESWLAEARDLVARLPLHQATLWLLRLGPASPSARTAGAEPGAAPAGDDLPALPEILARLTSFVEGHRLAEPGWPGEAAGTEIARIDARLEKRYAGVDWVFPDTETQWRHDALAGLVTSIERLADDDQHQSVRADVASRVERAWHVDEMQDEFIDEWEACLEALADPDESPIYGGLAIDEQIGLVPLGVDPNSGLWEFADIQTGRVPERSSDGSLEHDAETAMVFVLLPGGRFFMGAQFDDRTGLNYDPNAEGGESPVHEVELDPFFCSKYEMTQAQWALTMSSNPSYYGRADASHEDWSLYPVESVSWDECHRALRRLGMELPTEAQWEYAARGGTTTPWPSGRDKESLKGTANLADLSFKNVSQVHRAGAVCEEWNDRHSFVAPVGQFRPNRFGLHDVCGNVWEWCRDWRVTYSSPVRPGDGQVIDPAAEYHAYRGGSYEQFALMMRSSYRAKANPEYRTWVLGVRPVRALGR